MGLGRKMQQKNTREKLTLTRKQPPTSHVGLFCAKSHRDPIQLNAEAFNLSQDRFAGQVTHMLV